MDGAPQNHTPRTDPPRPGQGIKLVTVHGTGAGDTTATGDKWWQLGSRFVSRLSERLDLDANAVDIAPFQWDEGPNSEDKRRIAGGHLLERLQSYEAAGTDYYVIGHSHGGSVIYAMLLLAVQRRIALPHLKQWSTVGTPFLDYRPNKRLWQRLSTTGLTFFLSGLVAWLIVLSFVIAISVLDWTTDVTKEDFLLNFAIILAAYGTACIVVLGLWERWRAKSATKKQRKNVEAQFAARWTGYWHPEDEAISALVNVKGASGPIVPPNFLQPVVAGVQFSIILGFGLWVAQDTIRNGTILEFVVDDLYSRFKVDTVSPLLSELIMFALVCLTFVLVSCLILIGAWLMKKAMLYAGKPLSSLINRVIWRSVRDRAWGDDVTRESVRSVAPHPPGFSKAFDPLPDFVAAPLGQHSDKNAIDTLNKVRLILGMSRDAPPASDIKSELAESLRWKELIHTSYFDVPVFVDLLAFGLSNAGLAPVRDAFAAQEEQVDHMKLWLENAFNETLIRPK